MKPEAGRDVDCFSCHVKFQQEDDHQEYSIYLNPGFTPLKVEERTCHSRGSLFLIDYTDCAILWFTRQGHDDRTSHSFISLMVWSVTVNYACIWKIVSANANSMTSGYFDLLQLRSKCGSRSDQTPRYILISRIFCKRGARWGECDPLANCNNYISNGIRN